MIRAIAYFGDATPLRLVTLDAVDISIRHTSLRMLPCAAMERALRCRHLCRRHTSPRMSLHASAITRYAATPRRRYATRYACCFCYDMILRSDDNYDGQYY